MGKLGDWKVRIGARLPKRLRGRRQLAIVLVVPASVIALGLGYFLMHYTGSYADFDKQVNVLVSESKYDAAVAKTKRFINKSLSKGYKAKAWIQLGTIYINQKQYDQALKAFKQAEKLDGVPSIAVYSAIGLAAQKKGDKATALEAYKKALALANKVDPKKDPSNRNVQYFRFQIRALGGTP